MLGSTAKSYHLVSFLSAVSKVCEKLVNNRIFDHLKKHGLSSDFQYDFRSSRLTADLLTVISYKIVRAYSRSRASRAVARDISNAFEIYEYLALFLLFSVIDGFSRFGMGRIPS